MSYIAQNDLGGNLMKRNYDIVACERTVTAIDKARSRLPYFRNLAALSS
jgi:hypothetical protein